MSINIDAIKNRLGEFKSQKTTSKYVWRPKVGTTQIRLVPYKFNKENPFIEMYFHYEIGKSLLSPITFGKPDPVMKLVEKLLQKNDKDAYKYAKKIEPKLRVYVPMVERGKESEGIKFWGIGKTLYQDLMEIIADPDYGDITDFAAGRDIKVILQDPKEAGKEVVAPTIMIKPNTTPLMPSKDELMKLWETQQNINDVFTETSYEELEVLLEEYLSEHPFSGLPQSQSQTASQTPSAPTNKSVESEFDGFEAPVKAETKVKEEGVDDIMASFDEMYNT